MTEQDKELIREQTIILDGKKITEEQLNQATEQKNVRIVKQEEGSFKTLNRLHG